MFSFFWLFFCWVILDCILGIVDRSLVLLQCCCRSFSRQWAWLDSDCKLSRLQQEAAHVSVPVFKPLLQAFVVLGSKTWDKCVYIHLGVLVSRSSFWDSPAHTLQWSWLLHDSLFTLIPVARKTAGFSLGVSATWSRHPQPVLGKAIIERKHSMWDACSAFPKSACFCSDSSALRQLFYFVQSL